MSRSQYDYFEFGEPIDISQLAQDKAIHYFGLPVYMAWRNSFGQSLPGEKTPVSIRVVSVDRCNKTVTIECL